MFFATAEQVHGKEIALVSELAGEKRCFSGVDGLVTDQPGISLGVYVADCCAVFLVDPVRNAVGLVHSGKKGTALSIVTQIAVQAGVDISEALGFGGEAAFLARAAELGLTGAATFVALLLVYRLGAPVEITLKATWRSALITALAIDATVAIYAFYLVRIAGYDTIYGPLGAVLAFLALLYVAASLVLFGAELVASRED